MENMILIPMSEADFFAKVKDLVEAVIRNKELHEAQERLISATEVCKIFNPSISKVTLHRWTSDRVLNVYRMGGRIYYKYSEVIEAAKKIKKYGRNK